MISPMPAKKSRIDSEHSTPNSKTESEASGRFSLHRLSAAFARLTGTSNPEQPLPDLADPTESNSVALNEQVISPRMIVEGMLFVGTDDGRPLTNREMASHIRDVSPKEVDSLIAELNEQYETSNVAYHIASEGPGYRMRGRPQHEAVRQRFSGRVREAKLSPQAIEVLAIVAYRQPVMAETVTQLRGSRSHVILSQLVRRGLLCLERPDKTPRKPNYFTTEKFNRLFGVSSAKDLPNTEVLDDA